MERKGRILLVSFLNCPSEKCIGRQGKAGKDRERQELGAESYVLATVSLEAILTVSIHEDITGHTWR
jgi:hypothetical protein